jgi:thiamine-phosphate pyrophosphorylase
VLIVNDRLDVALATGADGVHLGQDDLPLPAARALAPAGFVIGVSTHDEAQARAARDGGATYIGFGPCFPTRTKLNPDPVVGLDQLARVCRLPLPVVAIGGIGLDTVGEVVHAGAAAAAVISAVNGAPDVVAAARQVSNAFARRSGAAPYPTASD